MDEAAKSDQLNQMVKYLKDCLERRDIYGIKQLLSNGIIYDLEILKECLRTNIDLIFKLCKFEFTDPLETVLNLQAISVNDSYNGKTLLQVACKKGFLNIVQVLLKCGANVQPDVWSENSVFYLASYHGHLQVINLLLSYFHALVQEKSIAYCMFYAACCSGKIDVVHKWYFPNTDLNSVIEFVPTLTGCELLYPLYGACKARHYEVACFLIENGASITKEICEHFPEFIVQLVQTKFQTSNLRGRRNYDLSEKFIKFVDPLWFFTSSGHEEWDVAAELKIKVNLSQNCLTSLPDGILWELQGLETLKVLKNPLRNISDAINPAAILMNSLVDLDLSYCSLVEISNHIFELPCLKELNLSNNQLTYLGNKHTRNHEWKCKKLTILNISNNQLTTIPAGIKNCPMIQHLYAHFNYIEQLFPPWQCQMQFLELSFNKLTSFSPSADQFWGRTLQVLKLNNNLLDELSESIVRMSRLIHLDVSHNFIERLPAASIWQCQLSTFYINSNQLGVSAKKSQLSRQASLNTDSNSHFEFPGFPLKTCLLDLSVADNKLKEVPKGICVLQNLNVLDLSRNVEITALPEELGTLKNLAILKLNGIKVKDKQLQALISDEDENKTLDIILYLERKLKKCVPVSTIKMVVLGCKNVGNQCIVEKLISGRGSYDDHSTSFDHQSLNISTCEFSSNFAKFTSLFSQNLRKSLTFHIWEFPEIKETLAVLPCFLTLNSIYLIVHDLNTYGTDLHLVSEKISVIQSCISKPKILIASLYSSNIDLSQTEEHLKAEAAREHLRCQFVLVDLEDIQTVMNLCQKIIEACELMKDSSVDKDCKYNQRQVPSSFIETARKTLKMKKEKIDICSLDVFLDFIECSKQTLHENSHDGLKLHEYLLQVGAMLHYNLYREELSQCVFLNPSYLFNLLKNFFKSLKKGKRTQMKIPIDEVKKTMTKMLKEENFLAFIHLLETFNIAIRIDDNFRNEVLIIPSLLPEQPPQIHLDLYDGGYRTVRLYCVSAIPSAFWSQVIVQLITAFERFSSTYWNIGVPIVYSDYGQTDRLRSFRLGCRTSSKGLHLSNKNIQFWRNGIMINHDQGYLIVEEVECILHERDGKGNPGILVTVQTTGSEGADSHQKNLRKLSVIGIVRDELEEILDIFFPKFHEPTEEYMKPYALCSHCYRNVQPFAVTIEVPDLHFCVRDCAQMVMWEEFVTCSSGPSSLEILVPEFLFFELPDKLRLNSENLELLDCQLGHGIAGAVQEGRYMGEKVAVKVFHRPTFRPSSLQLTDHLYLNAKSNDDKTSNHLQDQMETEQRKISSAFCDVRKEVNVLSKLKHKCIVAFLGVCVRPQLLLVMELAPLGSLRSVLNKKAEEDHDWDDKIISQKIFSKELTYKMILQITCGISYLHGCKIIYRDLKPDNILVMSLEEDIPINVKLSDYGISKFTSVQGLTGLFGTPGYMAPEVMSRQNYTTKVDIYSLSIVMLEILTGISPLSKDQKPLVSQMSLMLKEDNVPSQIKGSVLRCNFPSLEDLMPECWNIKMEDRPTADEIVKKMKRDQFILLHNSLWFIHKRQNLKISCVYACETANRWNIWISEYQQGDIRKFSVYDVESSNFTVYRWHSPGKKVLSMTKVGHKIWLVCQGLKHLEIIGRGNHSKMEVSTGYNFDFEPSKIFNHKFGSQEGSECFVFIGFDNGDIKAIYHDNPLLTSSVISIHSVKLRDNIQVTDFSTVNINTLAVSCGASIYFLEAYPQKIKNQQVIELTTSGSICLQYVLRMDVYEPIATITANAEMIWCSLENSSLLVRINARSKAVDLVLTLSWNSIRDDAILKKATEESQTFSGATVLTMMTHKDDSTISYDRTPCHSEVFRDSTESLPEDRPVLPPKRIALSPCNPPPLASKPHNTEKKLNATSLMLSCDVLVVGTDVGAIFNLPLSNLHNMSDTLQYPLLRHQTSKIKSRTRSKSVNTVAETSLDSHVNIVAALISVDEKLLSLITTKEPVVLRRCQNSKPVNINKQSKRLGSILTPEETDLGGRNDDSDSSDSEIETADRMSLSSFSSVSLEDENDTSGIADIGIWDKITEKKLNTIKKYIEDVS